MNVYQTKTSKKKGVYHILYSEEDTEVRAHCEKGSINLTHYKTVKPEITKYERDQKLCPLCVGNAYKYGYLAVFPTQ